MRRYISVKPPISTFPLCSLYSTVSVFCFVFSFPKSQSKSCHPPFYVSLVTLTVSTIKSKHLNLSAKAPFNRPFLFFLTSSTFHFTQHISVKLNFSFLLVFKVLSVFFPLKGITLNLYLVGSFLHRFFL